MLVNVNLNNTNLAEGGEPIHQLFEPYQKAKKNTWEKQKR